MGVLNVILFLISATLVSSDEYVPALVWSTQTMGDSFPVIPALSKLNTNEFSDYLLKRVKVEKPVILFFLEENLSVEDFSWKDFNGNGAFPMLSNITRMADDVAFLPSVHNPNKALKKLRSHGYLWKNYEKDSNSIKDGKAAIYEVNLDEPEYLEDRPDMLKRHDEKMAAIYNEALTYSSNVLVIYSGSHSSWTDAELGRFKREDKDTSDNNSLVISDKDNVVRMVVSIPIIFQTSKGTVNITKFHGDPVIKEDKNLIMRVRFPYSEKEDLFIEFKFSNSSDWWALDGVDIPSINVTNMASSFGIEAPSSFSYFCNPDIVFTKGNNSLILENFQVQLGVGKNNSFGPVIHCVPYFSIGILSGLVVVFILSVVLAWGITMIMDINTNDRFDDPKGKTITITASD